MPNLNENVKAFFINLQQQIEGALGRSNIESAKETSSKLKALKKPPTISNRTHSGPWTEKRGDQNPEWMRAPLPDLCKPKFSKMSHHRLATLAEQMQQTAGPETASTSAKVLNPNATTLKANDLSDACTAKNGDTKCPLCDPETDTKCETHSNA